MLKVESVQKQFPTRTGTLTVLRDVSLALEAGQSAAIVGPSGSGKSTLLNIIGTLEPPSAGRVLIDECDPFALSAGELARFRNEHIGLVFQDHHLLPQCSVLENVLLPALAADGRYGARPPQANGRHGDRPLRTLLATPWHTRASWSNALGWPSGRIIGPPSFPAVSGNASPSPAHCSIAPGCCWPTSPPATSITGPPTTSPTC